MARDSILRPDGAVGRLAPRIVPAREESGDFFAGVSAKLREQGADALPSDLVLDLVLNQLVEEARSSTMAAGAAIALWRGDVMVCRATSGVAPELSVIVETDHGLSGACVQSREVQICTDVVGDSRVDADAGRRLGARSILVYPLTAEDELLGILEVFSPRPHAFHDRDVQVIKSLAMRVRQSVLHAREFSLKSGVEPSERSPERASGESNEPNAPVPRDYWTTALIVLVVAVAVLLGWVLGRGGWLKKLQAPKQQGIAGAVATLPQKQAGPQAALENAHPADLSGAAKNPVDAQNVLPRKGPLPGGLTVYQDGKVIFHQPPSQPTPVPTPGALTKSSAPVSIKSVVLPPETAASYLISRVEPEYPPEAQAEHIQGPVTLEATVDAQGLVQQLSVVNGPPQLTTVAMDAVRQWRFHPYQPNGVPEAFETRITVNFLLPH